LKWYQACVWVMALSVDFSISHR